jgi:hypothetical protein
MAIGTIRVKIGDNIRQRTITTIVAIIINQKEGGNDCGGGHVGDLMI